MAMSYQKPLKHGGSKIQSRKPNGQFTKSFLDCIVCDKCGAINLPKFNDSEKDGFRSVLKKYPTHCHKCENPLDKP